ncbi:MAG: tRNA uridine-5-carboxymethylaminomethyl(34) synthesis GTPase MnmE [Pseudomonadota bacterium]
MIKPLLADDTICALASGAPPSAIAIIRVSGPAAAEWLITQSRRTDIEPRHATLMDLKDPDGVQIDRALLLWMPGPQSYTGEDVLEIHLHGGQGVLEHALETLTSWPGIRLAEPGEFTRRAFYNGKLDLTQAEGIADLIESETRAQKDQALCQTEGALSDLYEGWKTKLQNALALLEVSIDFPDESEAPETVSKPVLEILDALEEHFVDALREGEIDQRVRNGFRVAILGEPNAGKSTLLNFFARRPAAIVTDLPGTTRDIVEVRCRLGGHIIWFQDTAGIRETDDVIEQEGIDRSRHAAETADLRLFLLPPGSEAPPLPHIKQETDLVIQTKMDLSSNVSLTSGMPAISAKTGQGCAELEDLIAGRIQEKLGGRTAPVLTRARHRAAIDSGLENLRQAKVVLTTDLGAELASESLRTAVHSLQSLLGVIDIDDILDDVFSEFCIGK